MSAELPELSISLAPLSSNLRMKREFRPSASGERCMTSISFVRPISLWVPSVPFTAFYQRYWTRGSLILMYLAVLLKHSSVCQCFQRVVPPNYNKSSGRAAASLSNRAVRLLHICIRSELPLLSKISLSFE